MKWIAVVALSTAGVFGQSQPALPGFAPGGVVPRRVRVDAKTAEGLVLRKEPIVYPDAARNAGIQGLVVLGVVTDTSGAVKDVTVISGDTALGEAAAASVRKWSYQPYRENGEPAEMETQVSITFRINAPPKAVAPPLGLFKDDAYSNDYFSIYYPLSRDWVRETTLMRAKLSAEGKIQAGYLLLAAVHIPQDAEPLRAESSFVVLALQRSGTPARDDCKKYLEGIADELRDRKEGEKKGEVTQFSVAGHEFYRADFEYRHGIDHGATLCTGVKEYLLEWNIAGWSKHAIETAVETLKAITAARPSAPVAPATATPASSPSKAAIKQVLVAQGVTMGLLVKKVQPVYPPEARNAHIQGTVRLRAVINKNGDVVDLEVEGGPVELVVSAVNAVRKWKYRPYLLAGEPVEVQTEIQVNYVLSGF